MFPEHVQYFHNALACSKYVNYSKSIDVEFQYLERFVTNDCYIFPLKNEKV